MSNTINIQKILGRKLPGILHKPGGVIPCVFVNTNAQTYWTALTAQNGGIPIQGSYYGLTDCQLIQAIDNWFIALASSGAYAALNATYLFLGPNPHTQRINVVNPGTYTLGYAGSTAFVLSNLGTDFNGIDQYCDTGFNASSLGTANTQLSVILRNQDPVGNRSILSASDGTLGHNSRIMSTGTGQIRGIMYATSPPVCASANLILGTPLVNLNTFLTLRRGSLLTEFSLYDNTTVIATGGARCGTPPACNFYIGANNNLGLANNFNHGTISFSSIGTAMNAGEFATFISATNTLMTTLGR